MIKTLAVIILLFANFVSLESQSVFDDEKLIAYNGFFDSYYSEKEGKIYLEVTYLDSSLIYVSALSQGIGSNDLFLDRGQLGDTRIVSFKKAGNKILLIQPNLDYRAITDNPLEKRSVEEAFAKSVLFGFPIVENTENGYLIDLTPFLMQDTHGVIKTLKDKKQGTYSLDQSRSALNLERTKSFPKNVDFDVIITLKGDPSGNEIKSVTPNPELITVFQHHSFVALPDDDFVPRVYHPNCGAFYISFMDYSSSIGSPMETKYIWRHRLKKKNPEAEISEAVEPIIYYLDNGTPEPIRSALLDGAKWWNQAFESAGYKDAFQVKILPDTIDPLDVRYNVIQWVHRKTRGWSYGGGVVDPRTGEIIKGHVSLGSLRVRQDFKIAQALMNQPFADGKDMSSEMLEFALARIRQLSAHEVGHTLGLAHNFAASTNDRASVMDYPHPLVKITDGQIDLSQAYDVGIGEWDKVSVAYAYSDIRNNEQATLQKILDDAMSKGLRYISDNETRPHSGTHAYAHLWDNGEDPIAELDHILAVRQKAIAQFGVHNVKDGARYHDLEDLFVLLYFFHRYQTEAAVKLIGGNNFTYELKGETENVSTVLSPARQKQALTTVLKTLDAKTLAIGKDKLKLFPVRNGSDRDRESFASLTNPVFDPLSAAATATDHTLTLLLNSQRCSRLILQKSLDQQQLGLGEMLDKLISNTLLKNHGNHYDMEIQNAINTVTLNHLIQLATAKDALAQVNNIVHRKLLTHLNYLKNLGNKTDHQLGQIRTIEFYIEHPDKVIQHKVQRIPDGSPIGTHTCTHG